MSESTKAELRARIRATRAARSPEEREVIAAALRDVVLEDPQVAAARVVAAYVAVATEPGTQPLIDALVERGVQVLLPVLCADGDLDWGEYDGPSSLAESPEGRHGLLEPAGPRLGRDAIRGADVVVVPALAVDRSGHRLGRGGGAYDRALTRVRPETLTIAVVNEDEVIGAVPVDPWDIPVRAAATSHGISVWAQ